MSFRDTIKRMHLFLFLCAWTLFIISFALAGQETTDDRLPLVQEQPHLADSVSVTVPDAFQEDFFKIAEWPPEADAMVYIYRPKRLNDISFMPQPRLRINNRKLGRFAGGEYTWRGVKAGR